MYLDNKNVMDLFLGLSILALLQINFRLQINPIKHFNVKIACVAHAQLQSVARKGAQTLFASKAKIEKEYFASLKYFQFEVTAVTKTSQYFVCLSMSTSDNLQKHKSF